MFTSSIICTQGVRARQRSRYLRFSRPPQDKILQESRKKLMKEKNAANFLRWVGAERLFTVWIFHLSQPICLMALGILFCFWSIWVSNDLSNYCFVRLIDLRRDEESCKKDSERRDSPDILFCVVCGKGAVGKYYWVRNKYMNIKRIFTRLQHVLSFEGQGGNGGVEMKPSLIFLVTFEREWAVFPIRINWKGPWDPLLKF